MSEQTNVSRRTRRDFMKTAGIVSTGIAAGSLLSAPAVHAASGSDVIRVGLVGCGGRGVGSLIDRFRASDRLPEDNMKVVALGDVFHSRAERTAADLARMEDRRDQVDLSPDQIFGGFDNYRRVTELSDLVLINSPPAYHPDHYLYAVEQGKHVFIEKPFCVDAEGYRRCMRANGIAEEKGLTVCAGFQRRYERHNVEWVDRILAGYIGDIVSSRVYWNGGGARDRGAWQEGDPEMRFQSHCWYVFNWLSGDHLVEQHCHNIDMGNWIHGKGDPLAHPVSCVGHGGRQVRRTPRFPIHMSGNIYDHHYVEYRYADNSVMHSMCRQIPNNWNLVAELVTGTKGRGQGHWLEPTGGTRWTARGRAQDEPTGYVQEHIAQAEAMRSGTRLHDGWHGATSSMVAVMGVMATYSGQMINWDDAITRGRTLFPYDVELTFDTVPPVTIGPDGTYEHAVPVPGEYNPFNT